MSNVYHWNQTPPAPEVTPRRMTIPELMQLRELLEAYLTEMRIVGILSVADLEHLLGIDIRDNNR